MGIMPESGEDPGCLIQGKQVSWHLPLIPTFEDVSTIDNLPSRHGGISFKVDGPLLMEFGQVGMEHVGDMTFHVTLNRALGDSHDLHVLLMGISFDHGIIFVSSLKARRAQNSNHTLDGMNGRPRCGAQADDSKLGLGRL